MMTGHRDQCERQGSLEVFDQQPPRDDSEGTSAPNEFLIICLCAEWCGVCREYRKGFQEVARQFPVAGFHWLDIEANADQLGDIDVDNFPTLLIKRQQSVLFYGPMQPTPAHLKRTLQAFLEQTAEQSRQYAYASVARCDWQENDDLRRLGPDQPGRITA